MRRCSPAALVGGGDAGIGAMDLTLPATVARQSKSWDWRTGLDSHPSTRAASNSVAGGVWPREVRMISRVPAMAGSDLIWWASSSPSIWGMRKSSNAKS